MVLILCRFFLVFLRVSFMFESFRKSLWHELLSLGVCGAIILQPLSGVYAQTSDNDGHANVDYVPQTDYPDSPEDLGERAFAAAEQDGEQARLDLTREQKNIFYLLSQDIIERKTG